LLTIPAASTNCDQVVDHGSSPTKKAITQNVAQVTRLGRRCQSTLAPSKKASVSQSQIVTFLSQDRR
jgi:hypothetical protein